MRARLALLLCLVPLLYGCDGMPLFWWHKSALRNAQVLELYSLSAVSGSADDKIRYQGVLRGHRVIGKAAVTDKVQRERLVAAFEKAVADSSGEHACFLPRHAIRTLHDGHVYDFVICFQCLQVEVHGGTPSPFPYLVDKSAEPLFDEILRELKVVTSNELERIHGSM